MKLPIILVITLIVLFPGAVMNAASDFQIIPGQYLLAWRVSYDNFLQIVDLSKEEKNLSNYDIRFHEEGSDIIIKFIPHLLDDIMAQKLNRIVLGREVEYYINKIDYSITKRIFYKA